ncbi:L-threonylcarbamoyladenylate synthase [Arenimonas donghaensis]|nr:L-threonylcarbamoyladenylate synthase [Arenimonas donghaensis]
MAERLMVHPVTPQQRLVDKAVAVIRGGGLALVPTDAGYSLAWGLESRDAEARVQRLRELDSRHPFTLLCRQLSEAGRLARLDDPAFRLLRSLTPGPCTFILPASPDLPKRIKNAGRSKRRDIGIRLPDHVVTRMVLESVGEPLLSTSLVLPDEEHPNSHEADQVADRWLRWVDVMLDAEDCEPGPTSIVDCTGDEPEVIRQGFHPVAL